MPVDQSQIEIRVLGTVSVSVLGVELSLSPVERHLVALLAAIGKDGLDADRLADQLWPDRLPNTWKASLRNNVSRLNRKVEDAHPEEDRLISERVGNRQLQVGEDAVDLWRLQAWALYPDRIESTDVDADRTLLGGAPFPNCEISPLLRRATETIAAARHDIVNAWIKQGEHISHRLLVELRRLCIQDPFNEPLAESVVELHLAIDEHDLANRFLVELQLEAPLSEALAEVFHTLQHDRRPGSLIASSRRATFPMHSSSIARLTSGPLAGRTELVNDLLGVVNNSQPGVLIHGEAGIGKTRLGTELASRLGGSGYHTAYVVADDHSFGSLQPFLDAFPDLAPMVRPYIDRLHDSNVQAACRQEILRHLESAYAGRPLCLVIDDIQWLDDQSGALLVSLCRAKLTTGLFVIGIGRTSERSGRWAGWLNELGRTGLVPFKVRPLDQAAMVEMITTRFGPLEQTGARSLANQLLDLSSGIPEVAQWLLERTDENLLEIRMDDVDGTGYDAMVRALEAEAQRCGAIGSILGPQFDVEELARLGGYELDEVDQQLQQLLESGLIAELVVPGRYRFVHILAAEAFGQTLSVQQRGRLHADAFDLAVDPISQARHAESAAPIIGTQKAAAAQVDAARHYFAAGSYRATASAIQQAVAIDHTGVESVDEIMWLEAMERSGIRAGEHRQALVARAIDTGDHETALAAAASGLPDTEALEGDLARVEALQRIDPNRLEPDDRIHLHVQLSRQLRLLGRTDESLREAGLAATSATTADHAAHAWLARRFAEGIGRPVTTDEVLPSASEIESEELRIRIRQAEVVGAVAAGQSLSQFETIADYADSIPEDRLPQLYWMSQMYLVTALTDQGRHDEAMRVAEAANRFGLQAGLRIAAGVYETQQFTWAFHKRSHGSIFPFVANGRAAADISGNVVFEASIAASHFAFAVDDDERRRALNRVKPIWNKTIGSLFDFGAIGLMVEPIAATGDTRLMASANERLADRSDAFILIGSAAANLGPCTGLMAKLQTDRRSAIELCEQAILQSDAAKLPLWQIIGRLELAGRLGPTDDRAMKLMEDAREFASSRWLEQVVAGRT